MEWFVEAIKAVLFGLVQGITEWLPVSSTGHMILLEELVAFQVTPAFMEMFRVVIQFGSILAVVVLYFGRLWPFGRKKSTTVKKTTWSLWGKILVAALPAAVFGLLFDELLDTYLYNYITVAVTLILYGVLFILIERGKKNADFRYETPEDITYGAAFKIGCFQILSLIPGTSRSGSTILGGLLTGVKRSAGAEFSFFLAIPVMLGASALKLLKFGFAFTGAELVLLGVGVLTAFLVSLVAIRFLVSFVRRHSFAVFGWYRIALGVLVLLYFFLTR